MTTTETAVTISEFEPTDAEYEAVAAINNAVYPELQNSPDEWRFWDEGFKTGHYTLKRYVAREVVSGRIVARGEFSHSPRRFDPDRYDTVVEVDPAFQSRGIGTRMYAILLADLKKLGARRLAAEAKETNIVGVSFADRRGFAEIMRAWESRIDPQSFDSQPFQHYVDNLAEQGIVISTLADEMKTDPDWLAKVHRLAVNVSTDVPSPYPYTDPGIERYRRFEIESPEALHDAFFIAKDGARYVGLSHLGRNLTGPEPLFQDLTGVESDYRGRGIAYALKVHALLWAREHGYSMLKTWNNTLNAPMLAVNAKLGFVRQPAWIELEKKL